MQVPIDKRITELTDIPFTIGYVIRKRQYVDSLNEFPKDKRPTEWMIWNSAQEEIDEFIDKVYGVKKKAVPDSISIYVDEVE